MRKLIFIFAATTLSLQLAESGALANDKLHAVGISPATAVSTSQKLSFSVRAFGVASSNESKSIRDYWVNVTLPDDVTPDIRVGDLVPVQLPVVRNRETRAKVVEFKNQIIRLLVSHQVQYLEGQTLTVSIPIQKTNLFFVPFQAIYSPRGGKTKVFVLDQDNKTKLVPVKVLQMMNEGTLIVSSPSLAAGVNIITHGLENLGDGEKVRVIETKKEYQK